MNVKLSQAIHALDKIFIAEDRRKEIDRLLWLGWISTSDGWVSAILGCSDDKDIPSIAYEFFIADIKSGYFDMKVENDNSHPESVASP